MQLLKRITMIKKKITKYLNKKKTKQILQQK